MKALVFAAVAALAVGSVASTSFAKSHEGGHKAKNAGKKSSKKEEAAPAAAPTETAPAAPADAHAAPAGH